MELGLECGTPFKPIIMRTICLLKPKRYRSPFTKSIAKENLQGGIVPQFWGGVELEGRVWHPAKVLRIR